MGADAEWAAFLADPPDTDTIAAEDDYFDSLGNDGSDPIGNLYTLMVRATESSRFASWCVGPCCTPRHIWEFVNRTNDEWSCEFCIPLVFSPNVTQSEMRRAIMSAGGMFLPTPSAHDPIRFGSIRQMLAGCGNVATEVKHGR